MSTLRSLRDEFNGLVPQAQERGINVNPWSANPTTRDYGQRRVNWLRQQLGLPIDNPTPVIEEAPGAHMSLRQIRDAWNELVPQAQARGIGVQRWTAVPDTRRTGMIRLAWLRQQLGTTTSVIRTDELGLNLPDAPVREFERRTAALPITTEAERLVVQRIGQNIFRESLMNYWQGRCPLTGISDAALLRASHIIRWAECESNAERLDVHNGLLLSALWDAAFDRALVTFDDEGRPEFLHGLSEQARAQLHWHSPISLTDDHRRRLARHRERARSQSLR